MDGKYEYEIGNDDSTGSKSITITKYKGKDEKLTIPALIEGITVTSIGDEAFFGCESITYLTFPNSITFIGESAFSNCTALNTVKYSENDIFIDDYAFLGCEQLKEIILPGSLKIIRIGTFCECRNLAKVYLPEGLESIEDEAFYGCEKLRGIAFPKTLIYIGANAFCNCKGLESITIPESLVSIGDRCEFTFLFYGLGNDIQKGYYFGGRLSKDGPFSGCENLRNVFVASGNPAFSGIDGVLFNKEKSILLLYPQGKEDKSYIVPAGTVCIGDGAFHKCEYLTDIILPKGLKAIDGYAFSGCTWLTGIVLPSSLNSIGKCAFEGCQKLEVITLTGNIKIKIEVMEGFTGKIIYQGGPSPFEISSRPIVVTPLGTV